MKYEAPPFLISTAILFWGWQTGFIGLAIALAGIFESARFIKDKWALTHKEFEHIGDLCFIILVMIIIYGLVNDEKRVIFLLLKLLPCIAYPLLAAQQYSSSNGVFLSSLLSFARKKTSKRMKTTVVNVSFPYFIVAIISAGSGNMEGLSYYYGIMLLGIWALFSQRTKRFSLLLWITCLSLCCGVGWIGHVGIYNLQSYLSDLAAEMFSSRFDPFKTRTSIGEIGKQKMRSKILFRVEPEDKKTFSLLLRQASYQKYRSGSWFTNQKEMTKLKSFSNRTSWFLGNRAKDSASKTVTIHAKYRYGRGVIPQPMGSYFIQNFKATEIKKNGYGSAKFTTDFEDLMSYELAYTPEQSYMDAPTDADLVVAEDEHTAIKKIVNELDLRGKPTREIMKRLNTFFQTQFAYTLDRKGKGNYDTALANFLLSRRAGHCEFFATATVLALRECGIPARYAIGYLAQEYSRFEKKIIVRHRHGHAWTLVYIDGKWENFDTTTANWLDLEEEAISPLTIISDLWSFLGFSISSTDWKEQDYLISLTSILLVILIVMMIKRTRKGDSVKRVRSKRKRKNFFANLFKRKQATSDFKKLEDELADLGYERRHSETLRDWRIRLCEADSELLDFEILDEIIRLHHHEQFSIQSLSNDQSNALIRKISILRNNLE